MKAVVPSRKPRSDEKRISKKTCTAHTDYCLQVQDDGRKHLTLPEKNLPSCTQTETVPYHSAMKKMNQNACATVVGNAADAPSTSAVNETGTDRYAESTVLPDTEMRLLREQAACQQSFVDLLIGLVPFDALIPHEDTCSTSCSKAALAGNPSRGLLRWKQQCLRYDPAVLRATSFCLEQHVRDQEKERDASQMPGPRGKRHGKEVSRPDKKRRQKQRAKSNQRKRTPNDEQLGQDCGEGQSRTEDGKPERASASDKHYRLNSKQEQASRKGVRLQDMETTVGGVRGAANGSGEDSRNANVGHGNVRAKPAGNWRSPSASPRMEGKQTGRPHHKHRNTAGGTAFRSSEGNSKTTNKSARQHASFKRQKRSQNYRVGLD